MIENNRRPDDDHPVLRRSLALAADRPAPDDLSSRILERPEFQASTSRSARRAGAAGQISRRSWTVLGAAASVAAVVLAVAVVGGSARPDSQLTGPAAGADTTEQTDIGRASSVPPTTASPTSLPPALLPGGDYQAWASQTVPCGGVAAVPDAGQQLLSPDVAVVGAVVCDTTEQQVTGDGVWLMAGERELTPAQVAALASALTAANKPVDPAAVCTADLVLIPDFALVLADGRTVRPGVPGDGCHPSREVAGVLAPGERTAIHDITQVRQLRSQAMVDAGCDPASVPYWDPFSSGGTGTQGGDRPKAPSNGTVCRYESTGNSPETWSATLTALGTPSPAALKTALTPVLSAQVKPAASCTAADHSFDRATDGWLAVVIPAPSSSPGTDSSGEIDKPGSAGALLLSVELGGCHRVIAADGTGWFAPGPAVAALAALADRPVVLG